MKLIFFGGMTNLICNILDDNNFIVEFLLKIDF